MKRLLQLTLLALSGLLLASCGDPDLLQPSQKIGPMWVNRYGHSNAQSIWEYCDDSLSAAPGVQVTDCAVPWVDELFIGYGVRGQDAAQRDALWEARTWELSIDGHAVDLPSFNIADFDQELDGVPYAWRVWRIRLRKIPAGLHTLRYVMQVGQPVEGDPDAKSPGLYELIVNFTFEEK
ncbi:MAG: hypothetical protein ACOYYJ_12245 [Chloroflexota bacterium]